MTPYDADDHTVWDFDDQNLDTRLFILLDHEPVSLYRRAWDFENQKPFFFAKSSAVDLQSRKVYP